jgi:sortase A
VRRFGEGDPLLKVGLAMMAFAVVLTIVAVAVVLVLREEPERAVASEAAAKSSPRPLKMGDPLGKPSVEEARPQAPSETQNLGAQSRPHPEPRASSTKPAAKPRAQQSASSTTHHGPWPTPTKEQLTTADEPRHYDLPSGAIMGLTIAAIGVYDAPVFDSDSQWALTNGVGHVPQTSLPWSETPQRNVYLEGHRIGWPGTGSYLVFYHLDRLKKGDEVVLRDRGGEAYRYRVSEVMEVDPSAVWVMGQVRGRDMVSLQTCTPIPTYQKRLVVRADRVA